MATKAEPQGGLASTVDWGLQGGPSVGAWGLWPPLLLP